MQVVQGVHIMKPRNKKCAACQRPAESDADLCIRCAAQFERIYGKKEDMGKNKSKGQKQNKIAGAPRALTHEDGRERTIAEILDALYEVVAGDSPPSEFGLDDREAAERILKAVGDEGLKVLARAEIAWLERVEIQKEKIVEKQAEVNQLADAFDDEIEEEHQEVVATRAEAAAPAPEVEKKTERIPGWRSTPSRVLKSMLDHFKWYDWEALGYPQVKGAEALLKFAHGEAMKKEAAAAKKPPKKVDVGVVCRIRERHRDAYDGVLEVAEMAGLTVVSLNGKFARVKTAGGETLVPRAEHLEVDPDAAQPGAAS